LQAEEREAKLNKLGDVLQVLDKHIDFTALASAVDKAMPRPSRANGGRPPFASELMVRVLIVQQMFNLNDEQMEYQLLDRLSFQRFVGLRQSSQIQRNKRISKTRVRVEHPFASLIQMGGKLIRSIGLRRATLHLNWKVATYNMRRMCCLKTAKIAPLHSRVVS